MIVICNNYVLRIVDDSFIDKRIGFSRYDTKVSPIQKYGLHLFLQKGGAKAINPLMS